MIKILHLTSLKCGGAESVLVNYYKEIDERRVKFDFLIFSDSKEFFEDEILSLGANIYKADPNNKFSSGNMFLKKLRYNNYSAIEIHAENAHSIIWVILAYFNGFKNIIIHSHSTNTDKIIEHYICKVILNTLPIFRFSCDKNSSQFMFGDRYSYIVNNAIDSRKYTFNQDIRDRMRNALKIRDEVVIGHVGRFIEIKNQKLILQICKCFCDDGKNIKFLMIGDGETREKMEELSKKLKIDNNIIFTGNVRNVNEYLQAMDLFLLPSYYEGFPTVLVEAQAAGLKCLVSDSITATVNITGLIDFFSLKEHPDKWKKKIESMVFYNRKDMHSTIESSGLDIKTEAKKLTKKYIQISESHIE